MPSPSDRSRKAPVGAHVSSAGGLFKAFERARAIGAECLQIFTRAPSQWAARPLEHVEAFRSAHRQTGWQVFAHDLYLTNLASADPVIRERSIQSQILEVRRCHELGLQGLVCHMGSHPDEAEGLRLLVEGLRRVLGETAGEPIPVLLETTAGQGSCLGHRFEHIAHCLEALGGDGRLGVCLDTCHCHAAGYDMQQAEQVMLEFQQRIGLERLRLLHLNDSQKPLGSRVDRHAHIGKGEIGLEGFRYLVRSLSLPMIIETPENEQMHAKNLRLLKRLRQGKDTPRRTASSCPLC